MSKALGTTHIYDVKFTRSGNIVLNFKEVKERGKAAQKLANVDKVQQQESGS